MSRVTEAADHAGEGPIPPLPDLGGVVATSHPRAVEAATGVLRDGGNAVDAAVAAALVLAVCDPMSTGPGGDCFALVWREDERRLHGLNGSGRAPARASLDDLERRGLGAVPEKGILSVTVPGAIHGYAELLERHGTRSLGDVMEPAIRAARDGFVVTPVVGRDWAAVAERLARGEGTSGWLPAPRAGETFRAPDLARSLETIARDGIGALYGGPLGEAMVAESDRLGGWLAMADLEAHRSDWVEPIEATYRGHEVYELPPNGQGLVVLIALRILDAFSLLDMAPVERAHVMIEAIKLAFADGKAVIGDPASSPDVLPLLEDDHIAERIARIGPRALVEVAPGPAAAGDTATVAVVDRQGRAVSLIHSLFHHFGSHVVVPGTGITLQNRGSLLSDPRHPNALGPSLRPYHTIIPAMVFRGGRPFVVLGVVGGFQQPQAQVQILTSLVDLDLPIQTAVDAPRFRWLDGARVRLERGTPSEIADGLRARGHVVADDPALGFGGAQAIVIDPATGARDGATDPRKDGTVGRV